LRIENGGWRMEDVLGREARYAESNNHQLSILNYQLCYSVYREWEFHKAIRLYGRGSLNSAGCLQCKDANMERLTYLRVTTKKCLLVTAGRRQPQQQQRGVEQPWQQRLLLEQFRGHQQQQRQVPVLQQRGRQRVLPLPPVRVSPSAASQHSTYTGTAGRIWHMPR
jgi:hypothetical protein